MNNLPIEIQEIIFEYLQDREKKNKVIGKLIYSIDILKYCFDTYNEIEVDDIFYYLVISDFKNMVIPHIKYKIEERLSSNPRYHYYYSKKNR